MRRTSFLVCLLVLTLGMHAVVWAGPHEDYFKGQKDFKTLLADSKRGQLRSEWLTVLSLFEKSLQADSKGPDAPKCMYFVGRVHEELGRRSALKEDRHNALNAFDRMLSAFPNHEWSDDSQFRKGLIWREQLKNTDKAAAEFQAVLNTYPKGDMVPESRAQLSALDGAAPASQQASPAANAPPDTPATPTKVVAPAQTSASTTAAGTLKSIRHWSSNEYTRVVLDVDADTIHEHKLLEAAAGKPRQLQIDLPSTKVDADVMPSRVVRDGILSHIRVAALDTGRTQVTLDLLQMDRFRTFTLPDPFRIVVDVFGEPTKEANAAQKASTTPKTSKKITLEETNSAPNHVESALAELKEQRKKSEPTTQQRVAAPQQKSEPAPSAPNKTEPTQPDFKVSAKQKKMTGSLVEQLGLTVRTIMIDPGHGGKDPGATAHGLREKDVNLRMAKVMGKMLEAQGFEVAYTRTKDIFIPLEERTARANAKNADLFISLHCNAYRDENIKGLEIYYLNLATDAQAVRVAARENGISEKKISDMQFILSDLMLNSKINESRQMAAMMQQEAVRDLRKKHQITNHGVKGAFFYVLTGARMPAVLVELGYLTNPEEAALLTRDDYLQTLAQGMVSGVVAYKRHLERYALAPSKKNS